MNTEILKKIAPYLFVIVFFALITIIYFNPILEGKSLRQSDVSNWKGMSKEIADYRNETGEEALWTNSMFGGMPAYQVSINYQGNLIKKSDQLFKLWLPSPAKIVFLYLIGFFVFLRTLKVKFWLSIAGAIAFAFSSYFFIIIEAGHITKAYAIGYIPFVLSGVFLCFQGKHLIGGVVTALFLSLEITARHPQITYYLFIILFIYGFSEFIYSVREKKITDYLKSMGVLIVALILALAINISNLWGTYEYSKYTIRSQSELSFNKVNQTTGLDKDYATAWSYGIPETMTLLIPNFQGGASYGELSKKSKTYEVLTKNRVPNATQIVKQLPLYWGNQPGTSGPVYVGAIVMFLFVFGLFIVESRYKWWLLTATILSIFLAWGKNFMPLTNFFLDYIPMYNKFRAVSMTLVIAQLTIPLMAILAFQRIFDKKIDRKKLIKSLKHSFIIVGGLLLIFIVFAGTLFDFSGPRDDQLGFPDWLLTAIHADRLKMLRMDVLRSLIYISLAALLLWSYLTGKLKEKYLFPIIIILILVDMWSINKRYLNNENFIPKSMAEVPFNQTKADLKILKDTDISFRVFNLLEPFDKSARTSYFHKNIGGYHGAKFRRYQELVDYQLSGEREQFITLLSNRPDNLALNVGLMQLKVFNMLNTKYIIYDFDSDPLINNFALGNAWFVSNYQIVDNADAEITALNDFYPATTAIIDRRFNEYLVEYRNGVDSAGQIELTDYKPNYLTYQYNTVKDQLTLFSEIFYDKGWKAYVDGQEVPHFRANYILRAMILPAGEHTLEFEFKPRAYYLGGQISLAASIILILLIITAIIFEWKKQKKQSS
ncbi:MAG: YfhO family protein [Bacteroidales bacterium]|nr:YfhO family protein [Bacteroidales bacterium]